jgi:hypothetical protein
LIFLQRQKDSSHNLSNAEDENEPVQWIGNQDEKIGDWKTRIGFTMHRKSIAIPDLLTFRHRSNSAHESPSKSEICKLVYTASRATSNILEEIIIDQSDNCENAMVRFVSIMYFIQM